MVEVSSWITSPWRELALVLLSTVLVFLSLVVYTRLSGLRSFSKMSGFDFATTIAVGSILGASIVSRDPPVFNAWAALGAIFFLQFLVALARRYSSLGRELLDNEPRLLMAHGEFHEENMRKGRVTHGDVYAKLREANCLHVREVRAVILETTGDISVLHASSDEPPVDEVILADVIGIETTSGPRWSEGRASDPSPEPS